MELFIPEHLVLGPSGALAFLASDLLVSLLFGRLPAQDKRFDLIGEYSSGKKPVQHLRAILLALDLNTGRQMFQVTISVSLIPREAIFAFKASSLSIPTIMLRNMAK